MPPKKKQKLIKGQSFISFGRPNEQTEDKVDKSDPGPSTQQLSLIGRNFLRKKVRKSKGSDHMFSGKTGKCYTRDSFMRMGQCSVACVAKQGAKIRFHNKAAEILKLLPLLNMWQDKILKKPFVFLHSKKMHAWEGAKNHRI